MSRNYKKKEKKNKMNRKEKQFSLEKKKKKHAFWHQKINEGERERLHWMAAKCFHISLCLGAF